MGNHFTVGIETDRSAYYPGDTVTGKIVLTVDKPVKLFSLYVKINGTEKVRWTDMHEQTKYLSPTTAESASIREVVHRRREVQGRNRMHSQEEKVYVFPNELVPSGTHRYPFTFQLAANLRPACAGIIKEGRNAAGYFSDARWSLAYTLKAVCVPRGLQSKRRSISDLMIRERAPVTIEAAKMVQRTTYQPQCSVCSCFAKAIEVKEEIQVDKDSYTFGETINVTGDAGAHGRMISLVKTTALKTGTGSFAEFITDVEVVASTECNASGEASLTVPPGLSTTRGDIISLTYTLELDGHLPSESKVVLPLRIYRTPTESEIAEAVKPVKIVQPEPKETMSIKIESPKSVRESPKSVRESPKSVRESPKSVRESPKSVRESSKAKVCESSVASEEEEPPVLPGAITEA